jgi:predicted  nucleic acid-binding Zn-ribbon protein
LANSANTNKKLGKILLILSEKDLKICQAEDRKKEIANKKVSLTKEYNELKIQLDEKSAAYNQLKTQQEAEEKKVKEEQDRIVERRKQLVDLGGAKVAKIMEREVEIATKAMQILETATLEAMQAADAAKSVVDELAVKVAELNKIITEDFPKMDEEDLALTKTLKNLRAEKDKLFMELDPRLQTLYKRVNARYPATPVALANKNSCRVCYRALPQQTFNQIMAGYYLIQCPGCSRILVYGEE